MSGRSSAARAVWVCAAVAAASWGAPGARPLGPAPDVYELFERGNQLYEAGEFEEAVDVYQEAVAGGAVAPELFYNLGNAHFKTGDLGRAVLNYERSLRLAPRSPDARANLALVRSMLRDRQFIQEPGALRRAVSWLNRRLNTRESLLLTSILYTALLLVAIVFVFRETPLVSKVYSRVSLLSPGRFLGLDKTQDFILAMATLALLLAVSGTSAYVKYHAVRSRSAAIVVEEEVPVYSGPNTEATLQFRIHEGTRVSVGETRPGWVRVRLPGDLSGWMVEGSTERI